MTADLIKDKDGQLEEARKQVAERDRQIEEERKLTIEMGERGSQYRWALRSPVATDRCLVGIARFLSTV